MINIDVGRQLLVDDFLIASTNNTKRSWYQAKLLKDINPVLRPTEPWETVIDVGHPRLILIILTHSSSSSPTPYLAEWRG